MIPNFTPAPIVLPPKENTSTKPTLFEQGMAQKKQEKQAIIEASKSDVKSVTTAYVEEDPYPHLSHLKLTQDEEEIWWDKLEEGPRAGEEDDSKKDLDKMLCVNPLELCVITFLPTTGKNIEERREKTIEALQSLVEMWVEDKIRMFWVDVGEYPEADKLLNVSKT